LIVIIKYVILRIRDADKLFYLNRFQFYICLQVYKNLPPFIHIYSINTITFFTPLFIPLPFVLCLIRLLFIYYIYLSFALLCSILFLFLSCMLYIYTLSLLSYKFITINHRIFCSLCRYCPNLFCFYNPRKDWALKFFSLFL